MHHRRQVIEILATVLLTLSVLQPGHAAGQTKDVSDTEDTIGAASLYEVVSFTGDLLVWSSFMTEWTPLSNGLRFPAGTLLQSKGEGDLVLKRIGGFEGTGGDRALSMKLTVPTMLRIEDRLNRVITLSSFDLQSRSLNRPPTHQFGTNKPRHVVAGLPAAWMRVRKMGALIIDVADDSESLITPKEVKRAMAMEQKFGVIELSQPSDGAAFVVDTFPTHIPLAWEPRNLTRSVTTVDVYLRNGNDVANRLAIRTQRRALPLPIPRPGIYKIVVAAPELGIQSTEIAVSVEAQGALAEDAPAPHSP